ncbi:hypothetical protein ACOSQ2_005387 [Xanthoceras sorbifolium]
MLETNIILRFPTGASAVSDPKSLLDRVGQLLFPKDATGLKEMDLSKVLDWGLSSEYYALEAQLHLKKELVSSAKKAEAKAGEVKCNSQTHIEKLQQQVVELISSDVVRLRAQEEKINAPLEKVKKIAEDAVVKTKAELIKEIKEDRIDH